MNIGDIILSKHEASHREINRAFLTENVAHIGEPTSHYISSVFKQTSLRSNIGRHAQHSVKITLRLLN